jgi:hypothetical protein
MKPIHTEIIKHPEDLKTAVSQIFTILTPILKMQDKEKEVFIAFMIKYVEGVKSSPGNLDLVKDNLFSTKSKKEVRESLAMSEPQLNNYLTTFRKKKWIVNKNELNPSILKQFPTNGESSVTLTYTIDLTKLK